MPKDNIITEQKQGRLFEELLSRKLDSNHKLYKLKDLINWSELEAHALASLKVKKLGRNKKDSRVMLALSMLQAMYNGSDAFTAEELKENIYWQYFCGYEYLQKDLPVSEATIRRFRTILGQKGYDAILQELLKVGLKVGALKKKDLESVIIDTTVQIKNIKHPHDAYLLENARKAIVNLCKELAINLNETYAKSFKYKIIKLWKYKKDSKSKNRQKLMKSLKVRVGRLIRICQRSIETDQLELSTIQLELLSRIQAIHDQSVLNERVKRFYKENHKIIYSLHAPEVECIGKGKLNKPYEFGNKVGIAVSGHGNFILGVQSFHGNPYDGHTLAQTIAKTHEITNQETKQIFVDLGYRGHNYQKKGKIYTPYTKKQITPKIREMQKRRSAIEPIIGHLKQYGRMGRNYLKGIIGDILNPLISAVGLNLRNIANRLQKTPKLTL